MSRYLDPKTDLTFKRVFGEHKDLMISFLNAMLPLEDGKDVVDIEYLEPEMIPLNPGKKDSIVDVRCKDTMGRQFIVEMQLYWTNAFRKRALLNTCKAYSMQADKGMAFSDLKSVYTLNIINDTAFDDEEYYRVFVPTSNAKKMDKINDFVMIFVELPKFKPASESEKKMKRLWLRFLTEIKDQTTEVSRELLDEEHLLKAIEILEESAYTPGQLLAYDKYWDMVSRERTTMEEKYQQGHDAGRIEGREEGRIEERIKNAKELKRVGVPIETIANALNLDIEEVNGL